jgi:hypothetical protein
MTDERHFNSDDEMDAWLEDEAREQFAEMPVATEHEMPPGGSVTITVSTVPGITATTGATSSVALRDEQLAVTA